MAAIVAELTVAGLPGMLMQALQEAGVLGRLDPQRKTDPSAGAAIAAIGATYHAGAETKVDPVAAAVMHLQAAAGATQRRSDVILARYRRPQQYDAADGIRRRSSAWQRSI